MTQKITKVKNQKAVVKICLQLDNNQINILQKLQDEILLKEDKLISAQEIIRNLINKM